MFLRLTRWDALLRCLCGEAKELPNRISNMRNPVAANAVRDGRSTQLGDHLPPPLSLLNRQLWDLTRRFGLSACLSAATLGHVAIYSHEVHFISSIYISPSHSHLRRLLSHHPHPLIHISSSAFQTIQHALLQDLRRSRSNSPHRCSGSTSC